MIQIRDLEQEYGEQLDAMPLADVEALESSDFMRLFLRRTRESVPKYGIRRPELLLALASRSRDQQTTMEF